MAFCRGRVTFIAGKQDATLNKRIIKGVVLLIPVALLVLVLLSSADENFSNLISSSFVSLITALNLSIIAKVICIFMLAVILLACLHAWKTPFEYTENKLLVALDNVVIGIVMGGILFIYCLFLWLQLDYLMMDSLPENFSTTEKIVKSGFWQLFFLSILNTGLFFAVYKNTGAAAQVILRVFIIASGLLLLSAAWRMGMYVYWYGFSYEKFFAIYTTLFALLVFLYLVIASFSKARKDVFKFIAFAALWSFSVATVTPVERIIFDTNVALAQQSGSRVQLYELQQMSADILGEVRTLLEQESVKPTLTKEQFGGWSRWLVLQERDNCNRVWYESNLSLKGVCS
jgi:hypothetical protein